MTFLEKKTSSILLVIFTIAFLLRLGPVASDSNIFKSGDEWFFHSKAINILEGKGFSDGNAPTSYRSPAYSFFLAAIYFLCGRDLFTTKIIQAIMGAFLCILIYFIGKKVFSKTIGLVSALILAFNLNFIYMPTNILSENLYLVIFLVAILYLIEMWRYPSFKNRAMVGFSLGLAALTRAENQLLPAFIFLAMVVKSGYEREALFRVFKNFIVIMLFFVLPIAPWSIRNYQIHHTFVPIATEGGESLYISYAISEGREFGSGVSDEVSKKADMEKMGEVERSDYYYREAFKYIRANLSKLPKLTLLKMLFFWSPFEWELTRSRGAYNAMFMFSLPFFIVGMFFLRKRLVEFLPLYVPILYLFIVTLVFQACPRLRAQIEPCIIVVAAIGIWHFLTRFTSKLIPYLVMVSFLAVNFMIYLYTDSVKAAFKHVLSGIGIW